MTPLEHVLDKLPSAKRSGAGFIALCPAHDDHKPSLSITEDPDGRVLVHCHAGCSWRNVVRALELEERELFAAPTGNGTHAKAAAKVVQEVIYPIVNVTGQIVAEHVRLNRADGSKGIFWRRNGQKGLQGLHLKDLPLYGLPDLLIAQPGEVVVVTEGEKAREALKGVGILAVGTVTGAKSTPCDETLRALTKYKVTLWADNDLAGWRHMKRIAAQLRAMGVIPRRLEWPEAPPKGDAADFVAAGGKREGVLTLIEQAPEWESDSDQLKTATFDLTLPADLQETERVLIEDLLCADDLALWVGHEKQRKSTVLLQLCACLASGRSWLGFHITAPVKLLYIDAESKTRDLARRWAGLQQVLTPEERERVLANLTIIEGRKLLAAGQQVDIYSETLHALLQAHQDAQVVVLDPLRVFYAGDEDKSLAVSDALLQLRRLAAGRTLFIVHHARKRPGAKRDQLHLKDDPYVWSDNARGSNAWKAHADLIFLQELREDEQLGEVLDFAVIERSFPNVAPIPLIASEKTFAWHERLAEQDSGSARSQLSQRGQEILGAVDGLLRQAPASRSGLVEQLIFKGVARRSQAFSWVARFLQAGLLREAPDGRCSLA